MELFKGFGTFFKRKDNKVEADNLVFKLHYRFSFVILLIFSVLVVAGTYFGVPIECLSRDDVPDNLLNTFCWIHTTYSMDDAWDKKVGEDVPYPGVGPSKNGGKKVFHAYYQWVCWVLTIQAILFYIPHYVWKVLESGRLRSLVLNLNDPVLPKVNRLKDTKLLVDYFTQNIGQSHGVYFYAFVLLEVLNFANVVGQMFLIDRFLGGEFTTYGSKVLAFTEFDYEVRDDPMIRVFPRLTKCTFHRYGPSGDVTRHDAMCILPINILNEKLYIFLWFWFIIVAIISGIGLLYRSVLILIPNLRFKLLSYR